MAGEFAPQNNVGRRRTCFRDDDSEDRPPLSLEDVLPDSHELPNGSSAISMNVIIL